MGTEHLLFARETVWGTYVAPDTAFPVTSVGLKSDQGFVENNDTGFGKGRRAGRPGLVKVTGDLSTSLYTGGLPKLLRSVYGTRAKASSVSATTVAITSSSVAAQSLITTGAAHGRKPGDRITITGHTGSTPSLNGEHVVLSTPSATTLTIGVNVTVGGTGGTLASTALRNKLLPNDDVAFNSFSVQKRYKANVAESFTGVKVGGYKVTAKAGELAKVSLKLIGKDSAMTGGFYADGLTAAPAVVDPAPYPAGIGDPLMWDSGSIILGGTVALTAGELVVTGGTARRSIDNVEIDVDLGLIDDDFEIYEDSRVLGSLDEGKRVVKVNFEPNFGQVDGEFLNLFRQSTDAIVVARFRGANSGATADGRVGYHWVFPLVRYSAAPNPDLNSEYSLKRVPVKGEAFGDAVTGYDHGLTITSRDDLTV